MSEMDEECSVFNCKAESIFELTNLGEEVARFCSISHLVLWAQAEAPLMFREVT